MFQILSLDGGGSWCVVQARVLQDLYGDITGHTVLKKFDLVIANSGGSVLLGLLCCDLKLSEIITFYQTPEKLKQVFPKLKWYQRFFLHILRLLFKVGPKYHTGEKLEGLKNLLRTEQKGNGYDIINDLLQEIPKRIGPNEYGNLVQLVIPAFDYFQERVTFLRSNNKASAYKYSDSYYQTTLGEAIHASTNAPVIYYDRPARITIKKINKLTSEIEERPSWFFDGAIAGFNNPVLAGVVEALTNNINNTPISDFRILSLGTGLSRKAIISDDKYSSSKKVRDRYEKNKSNPFVEAGVNFSFLNDAKKSAGSILSDPPDSATFIACSLLNPGLANDTGNLVRINPLMMPVLNGDIYDYPKVYQQDQANFIKLMDLDFDNTEKSGIDLMTTMCDRFILPGKGEDCLPNQLIRGVYDPDDKEKNYLGHPTYWDAKEKWLKVCQR